MLRAATSLTSDYPQQDLHAGRLAMLGSIPFSPEEGGLRDSLYAGLVVDDSAVIAQIEEMHHVRVQIKSPMYAVVYNHLPESPKGASRDYNEHLASAAALYSDIEYLHQIKGEAFAQEGKGKLENMRMLRIISSLRRFAARIFPTIVHSDEQRGMNIGLRTLTFRDMGENPANIPLEMIEWMRRGSHLIQALLKGDLDSQELRQELMERFDLEEADLVWLKERIGLAIELIPEQDIKNGAYSQLAFTMLGITLESIKIKMDGRADGKEKYIFNSMKLGYYIGFAYALVDNVLDIQDGEGKDRQGLKEAVVALVEKVLKGEKFERSELPIAGKTGDKVFAILEDFVADFSFDQNQNLYRSLTVLHESQLYDQNRSNEHGQRDKDFYPDMALKAGFTRVVPYLHVNGQMDGYKMRFFLLQGLLIQMRDDFIDFYEDLERGTRTPYTHYYKHRGNAEITNPFMLIFTMSEMIVNENIMHGDVSDIVYSKLSYNLQAVYRKFGREKLIEFLDVFCPDIELSKTLLKIAAKDPDSIDVDFAFKRGVNNWAVDEKRKRMSLEEFITTYKSDLEANLKISSVDAGVSELRNAANYSLGAGGKRLRPMLTYMLAYLYGEDPKKFKPIAVGIESLHTASLIFDDLPAHDNAMQRRGKPTLHVHIGEANAQLAGIGLIARAFEEITHLDADPATIQAVVRYSAKTLGIDGLCEGQIRDLSLKTGEPVNIEELEKMSFLKTGLAIEASLIPVAIVQGKEVDMDPIKEYSYHLGIAFQIKDDILDAESDSETLGKDVQIDNKNNSATYVSVLGLDGAKDRLKFHLYKAKDALNKFSIKNVGLLEQIVQYVAERKN